MNTRRRESPFICGNIFFFFGRAYIGLWKSPFWTVGIIIQAFQNHERIIQNREQSGISRDFWCKSPQWGSFNSNCHNSTVVLQHYFIRGTLGDLRQYPLEICCLFHFIWHTAVQVRDSEFAILVSLQSDAQLNFACDTGFGLCPLCLIWPSSSQRADSKAGSEFCGRIPHQSYFKQSQNTI